MNGIGFDANSQRNAIVQALMNISNPPPATQMPQTPGQAPGQFGSPTRSPNVLAPPSQSVPGAGMQMTPPQSGVLGAAPNSALTGPQGPRGTIPPFAAPPGQGGGFGFAPQSPPQITPPMPGGGTPYGPQQSSTNMVGQQPPLQSPGAQLMPPGMNPQG
jgi:hypothetical protein